MTSRIQVKSFNLRDTFECGQFFRYTKVSDTYIVQSSGRIFSLHQRGNTLYYEGVEESFLASFLRMEDDFDSILKEIDQDAVINQAIHEYPGLRLIRQDPWECLLSFLCSSAKSIPHIRTMIEALCKSSGKEVVWGDYIGFAFPEPKCIGDDLQLESVKAGFRAQYLVKTSQCIDRNQLLSLKWLAHGEAQKRLMGLAGVGKKVADCVLLYSLDFLEAFPIDVWIKRGLQKAYFKGEKVGEKKMEEFVRGHFGPFAGYAQLYLYHFWRNQKT